MQSDSRLRVYACAAEWGLLQIERPAE